jgi:hypothetical protein
MGIEDFFSKPLSKERKKERHCGGRDKYRRRFTTIILPRKSAQTNTNKQVAIEIQINKAHQTNLNFLLSIEI